MDKANNACLVLVWKKQKGTKYEHEMYKLKTALV